MIDKKIVLQVQIGQMLSSTPLLYPLKGVQTGGLKWNVQNQIDDVNYFNLSSVCLADISCVDADLYKKGPKEIG